ncbi:F420H(2):quinone oxidoreductase [Clostridium beijerinckii]|nr:F420H(2):quinone oxidoreductase [Clostridium beijerinckii]
MPYKINLKKSRECDVFIIGAGIAGVMSAIQASNNGASVIISSSANILSGSSFYPGTWGLGLIGPENKEDEKDLAKTIKEVGCDVVDENLVQTFVSNIPKAIRLVKSMNINMKEAANKDQKEFIPCFDHKIRNWNGILFDSAKEVFSEKLKAQNIKTYPFSEVIEIIKEEEKVIGIILINKNKEFEFIKCKAIVIASGGIGGLFKYRLNTNDITGMGQSLALKSGCKLVNIEFMQMMPGYINPCPKTIFNEKTFKYVDILNQYGKNIFDGMENKLEKLEERSTHGPFTSRLNSREIDYKIFNEFMKDRNGVVVRYKEEIKHQQPEFIKVYFDWLKERKNLTVDDDINLGIYFHAANGGIKIDEKAQTGVNGLFAAGEVTGGMHGADRIGGLSTANGLVFGTIAGESASTYASNIIMSSIEKIEFEPYEIENAEELINELQEIMFRAAMIEKNEITVQSAIKRIDEIQSNLVYKSDFNMKDINKSYRLKANLLLSKCILMAIDLRKESRGSHYRSDYKKSNSNMNKKIIIELNDNIDVHFE